MKYLLGIDVGTTGTKMLLFADDGKLVGHAYRGYPISNPQVGWCEQDAEDWWQAVVETVREVCTTDEIAANVAAISLSLQGGTIVPVDAQGNALRPAIVWNDSRFASQVEDFRREVGDDDAMYCRTGWHLSNILPAMAIRWIKDNQPEIFAKTDMFLSVPDYISMKMTGVAAVDLSDAGINQLCDIQAGEYDEKLLAFAGVSRDKLAQIVHSGDLIGNLTENAAKELGLTSSTVLVAGAHDQYAVALGAGATNAGDIMIGSGTCWVVTAISDAADFSTGLSQSVAAVPGMWGALESLSSGGICLDWFRKHIANNLSYDELNRELECRKAAEDGLFFFPFSGLYDTRKRFQKATFLGLDLSHDRMDMARAIMEGVVFQTRWIMESFSTKPAETGIILAGGASKSPVWSQLVADICGLPVRIPEVADLACVGAAVMAGVGCGIFPDMHSGYKRLAVDERILQPRTEMTAVYAKLFEEYKHKAAVLGEL